MLCSLSFDFSLLCFLWLDIILLKLLPSVFNLVLINDLLIESPSVFKLELPPLARVDLTYKSLDCQYSYLSC